MNSRLFLWIVMVVAVMGRFYGQVNQDTILPSQTYIEDSTHVYWTWYPNPFSPPTVLNPDTSIWGLYTLYTFYCDLPDSISVALIDSNRNIVYSTNSGPMERSNYGVAPMLAGPHVRSAKLPAQYFQEKNGGSYDLMILVSGRPKTIRGVADIRIEKGQYFWMSIK
jgi:hypothetical protein